MEIKKINKQNYLEITDYTIKILEQGGLVVFPTDTVYGLLVDATNKKAVSKLIEFKNRPPGKAISIFVSDFQMLEKNVDVKKKQKIILSEILPGPYTVVLKSKHKVNNLLESEKGTLGVRIPKYVYISVLVNRFLKPVTATSANLTSQSPHYSIDSLLKGLSNKKRELIDLIVDAGKLAKNKPSTVVDLTESEIKVIRQGDSSLLKSTTFISSSPEETKMIAQKIIKSVKSKRKPVVFIIEGELGVGKTIFVKGIGENLGINNIVSPTYVIYYEYGNFYHFDLYQIEEKKEFKHLGIQKFLIPGNILCFEWGEKAGEIIDLLNKKGKIIYIKMKYLSDNKREIIVKY